MVRAVPRAVKRCSDHVDAIAALVHRILDKCQPAEFADDKQIRHAGLALRRQVGMSAPMLGLAITMVIAPTGQASAHRLCPMHL